MSAELRGARRFRAIALYLPQFHPIPENDLWWGRGFTEWTNTAKAKPLFRGHYQPHVPADLGFYDLRVPETRVAQADLARSAGIEGFCYYHYWFGGRRILERPFREVLESGSPDFPFCLCWANKTWTGIWYGAPDQILIEQTYPGEEDHRAHFESILPALRDPRYIRVERKPVFVVYSPHDFPSVAAFTRLWRALARDAGLPGLFLVAMSNQPLWSPSEYGFDAKVITPALEHYPWISRRRPVKWLRQRIAIRRRLPAINPYKELVETFERRLREEQVAATRGYGLYPSVIHSWDNTPRSASNGVVLTGATPSLYQVHLDASRKAIEHEPNERRIMFLKSWNEWAEGNHLEPDLRDGHVWLDTLRSFIVDSDQPRDSKRGRYVCAKMRR